MAQLTNTRIYGTLDVDKVINAKNGINLKSVIVDNKQDSTKNENKLSSIKLISENNSYGKIINVSPISAYIQNNSIFSYTAEIKNNTAEIKNNAGKLLSLDLNKIKSEEKYTFDRNMNVKTYNIDKVDTLYNISVNVSDFAKANSSKPNVSYGNVISKYTVDTENDEATGVSGTTNTTKSTVNLQLTVPYEGGEIITDKTFDGHTRYVINVLDNTQFTKLLDSNALLHCVDEGRNGVILHAILTYTSRDKVAYPVLFYIDGGSVCMSCFSYSIGRFEVKNSIDSGETLRLVVSTKELYDELNKDIA